MDRHNRNVAALRTPTIGIVLRSHSNENVGVSETEVQPKQISQKARKRKSILSKSESVAAVVSASGREAVHGKRPHPQARTDLDISASSSKTARNKMNGAEKSPKEMSYTNGRSSPRKTRDNINIGYKSDLGAHVSLEEPGATKMPSFISHYTRPQKSEPLEFRRTEVPASHTEIKVTWTGNALETKEQFEQRLHQEIEKISRKRKISYSHEPKSAAFAKRMVIIISKIPKDVKLVKFKMRNCGVTTEFLEILTNGIDPRSIRILDLSGNKDFDLRVMETFRKKLNSKVIDLSDTQLGAEGLEILRNMKGIKELRLNYKAFKDANHGSIARALVSLINHGLVKLSLIDSKITNKQLQKISEGLDDSVSLKVLNLSHVTLDKSGILAVARIVNRTKNGLDELVMSGCRLTTKLLASFEKFAEQEIRELDISSNPLIGKGGMEVLAKMADTVNCKNLDISSNSLNGDHIRQLIVARTPKQVQKLCLAENPGIDPAAVGELASKWKLLGLDVSECRQNAMAIEDLGNAIGDHTLHCIDVSDPMATVNEEKRKALKLLASKTMKLYYKNHEEFL